MILKPKSKLFKDLEGQKFNRLLVTEYVGSKKYPSAKVHLWKCVCNCGKEKIVIGRDLKQGNTKSCGCLQKEQVSKARRIDLTGKNFGKLTVVKFSHMNEKDQVFWLCKCECGKNKLINGASLRRGASKSCGCKQGRYTHGMWGKSGYKALYLKDPVKKIKHNIGNAVRDALVKNGVSKNGGKTFDHLPYSPQDLKEYLENQFEDWMSWKNYGGPNDSKEKTWHIDHIKPQSSFSFTSMKDQQFLECWDLSNLRPLEKIENIKKGVK